MGRSSDKRKMILEYIQEKYAKEGIPPSIREIGAAVRLKSTSTVKAHLDALERDGYIKKTDGKKRSLVPSNISGNLMVPILGKVAAGLPILAEENYEGFVPFSSRYYTNQKELFALTVKGDSMKNAGILDGDTIIVKITPVARNGEIVVALIENEATVKRFYKEDKKIILRPENEDYKDIVVDNAIILGRIISLVRYY